MNVGDDLLLGYEGGHASVTIEQNATVAVTSRTVVGGRNGGVSTLNISSGNILTSETFAIANENTKGHVDLTGAGTQLNIGRTSGVGDLVVGSSGLATLSVSDGANVDGANVDVADAVKVGVYDGCNGAVTIDGGTVSANSAIVGDAYGATGAVTVTGAGSRFDVAGSADVGHRGNGTLNIASSGQVDVGGLRLGANSPGSGQLDISSGQLDISASSCKSAPQAPASLINRTVQSTSAVECSSETCSAHPKEPSPKRVELLPPAQTQTPAILIWRSGSSGPV